MTINLAIAVAIIFIIMLLVLIRHIKNKKLQLSYTIFWLISGIVLVIILVIPNCLSNITKILGFEVPSNMIFFITIAIAFYLILELMIALSKENKRNITLIQEMSILKKRVEEIEERIKNNDGK